MNHVSLVGNVASCKVKQFANGSTLADLTIALNKKWKTQSGEVKERADFILCRYSNPSVALLPYIQSGAMIGVSGELRVDNWTDAQNNYRSITYVFVQRIEIIRAPKEIRAQQEAQRNGGNYAPQSQAQIAQQAQTQNYAPQAQPQPQQPAYVAPAPAQNYAPQAQPQAQAAPQYAEAEFVGGDELPF